MRNVKKEILALVLLTFLVSGCGFLRVSVYRTDTFCYDDYYCENGLCGSPNGNDFEIRCYDKPGCSLSYLEKLVLTKASETALAKKYTHFLTLDKKFLRRKSEEHECYGPLLDPITPCKVEVSSFAYLKIKCFKSDYPEEAIDAQQFLNSIRKGEPK